MINKKELIKKKWENRGPFKDAWDASRLPQAEKAEWYDFYIPRIIELGGMPSSDLVDGQWYYGGFRRSNFGKWNEAERKFHVLRDKFGWMWDKCNHFEDDNGFALFVPLRLATIEEIEAEERKAPK